MPSNFLLLLPLVGGYLFNHVFYKYRFRAQALAGHRLILEAAVSGLVFLGIARIVTVLLQIYLPEFFSWWPTLAGKTSFAGTSVLAVLLAPLTAWIANLGCGFWSRSRVPKSRYADKTWGKKHIYRWRQASREHFLDKAIQTSGNALQKLLHQAAVHNVVLSIGVTMDNGKIYAGKVTASPNLSPSDEYVSMLPLLSGHRDPQSLKIIYDTLYPVGKFERLADDHNVVVALPVSEIKSAHLLDEEYYVNEIERLEPSGA